ncbi:hypothetical protein [Flavobacterium humi]|uniref:Uncharacterized protein n=1 Tax=Flavobacterium humi TaxID=2562683 RepID=A0A4Z0L6Y6_9FLAO|nr:hypothetical protein [Flavobacterium humi]TGD58266.1 hypothetical protein E4635_09700 [Flavobacterium humi]
MQTLKQKKIFHEREFKILGSKLLYKEKIIGKSDFEAIISFEDLSIYKASHENSSMFFAIASCISMFLAFIGFLSRNDKDTDPDVWIVFTAIGIILLLIFLFKKEKSWRIGLLSNNTNVFIYKKIPNEEIVNNFIENIFSARNKYLRENYYMILDKNLNYEDQFKNLKWLKHIEAISKEEFDEKYKELKTIFNYDKKSIGFER